MDPENVNQPRSTRRRSSAQTQQQKSVCDRYIKVENDLNFISQFIKFISL